MTECGADSGIEPRAYPFPYKYVAYVAYDGTDYAGFQLQGASVERRRPSVQGRLEAALSRFLGLTRGELAVQGAARTDAGVHARGQAVHFFSRRELADGARATATLNAALPPDLRVLRVLRVPLDYNVRFSRGKFYTYDLSLEPIGDPFSCRFRHAPPGPGRLDLEALGAAAAAFVGTHDFSVFSNRPRDASARSRVREIRRCTLSALPGGARIEVEGDGFLYKQVRHMVGATLAAAAGRIEPSDIAAALADPVGRGDGALARPGAYVVAPPEGLCLQTVFLPEPGDPEQLMYGGVDGPALLRRRGDFDPLTDSSDD